jgi:hypothetical protein
MSYQRYLENILESTTEYLEIRDILSRYDTLAATNAELIDRARIAQEKTEADRMAFLVATEVSLCNTGKKQHDPKLQQSNS